MAIHRKTVGIVCITCQLPLLTAAVGNPQIPHPHPHPHRQRNAHYHVLSSTPIFLSFTVCFLRKLERESENMPERDLERGGGGTKNRAENNSYSASSYVYDPETHWTSWLVPMFVVANIAVFIVAMYINNCPKHYNQGFQGKCVARFLGRLSFQPLQENPLFGPSSNT